MTREEAFAALDRFREQIDEIDRRLIDLFNERTAVVEQIGRVKTEMGLPIYEPKREDQVYENVIGHNKGPLNSEAARRLFERIIDEMRTLQKMRQQQRREGEPQPRKEIYE
jgi:chorismate mutase